MAPVVRPAGTDDDALVLVDATSGAGGLPVDLTEVDVYYFAPQKCFASDGGLWVAIMSPRALARAERIAATGRYIPAFFDLPTAIDNSPEEPDLQHPVGRHPVPDGRAAGLDERQGGLTGMVERTTAVLRRALRLGREDAVRHAVRRGPGAPLAGHRHHRLRRRRSTPTAIAATLRANGIVDTEPYRKLGRNQLRVAMYPAIDPADVEALTACIDYVVDALSQRSDVEQSRWSLTAPSVRTLQRAARSGRTSTRRTRPAAPPRPGSASRGASRRRRRPRRPWASRRRPR